MNRVRCFLLGASMAALVSFAFAADGPTVLLPADSTTALKLSSAAADPAVLECEGADDRRLTKSQVAAVRDVRPSAHGRTQLDRGPLPPVMPECAAPRR